MPKIRGISLDADLNITNLEGRNIRIRRNLINDATPAQIEARFNLWVANNLDNRPFKAFLHVFSVSPFNVALMVMDKEEPDPVGEWWL